MRKLNEPVESAYFKWLCNKVMAFENPTPSLTYWELLKKLHKTEFVWMPQASSDDNREEDGKDLRPEFFREAYLKQDRAVMDLGCSMLEMLVAFSRRAEFETDVKAKDWFWVFITNLGLIEYNDANGVNDEVVDEILDRFIWRRYEMNGHGGMFPLRSPSHDQRKIELWYQLAEYLVDQEQS